MADPGRLEQFLAGAQVEAAVWGLRPDYRALLIAAERLVPGPRALFILDALDPMTDAQPDAAGDDLAGHRARLDPDVRPFSDRRSVTVSIRLWDAAVDPSEWREWLAGTDRVGILAVTNLDPAGAPLLVPTHFTLASDELLVHLARANPEWPHLETAGEVRLAVIGDYAYIPTYWRAKAGGAHEDGVPTSYYSVVQFRCRPAIVDDPDGTAELLAAQLADFQPEGGHAADAPYRSVLSGIRGLRLAVLGVDAKFKYDDHDPVEHRQDVIGRLEQRGHGLDAGAATRQRRRLDAVGDWRAYRDRR